MGVDFTVIQPVRQLFGDRTQGTQFEIPREREAPFVGKSKDFPFSCPNINPRQTAVLQFESLGVTAGGRTNTQDRNILRINGINIPGGITAGPGHPLGGGKVIPLWKSHSLIVDANVLKEQNVLHIEAILIQIGIEQTLDTFIIDNVVVFFKTHASTVNL